MFGWTPPVGSVAVATPGSANTAAAAMAKPISRDRAFIWVLLRCGRKIRCQER
jgi:hypothetical protein